MKKLQQILCFFLLLSLTVHSQNRETVNGTHEHIVTKHIQGQQQLVKDAFFGINELNPETPIFRSPSENWLLKDLSFDLQWDATESIWEYTRKYYYTYDENDNLIEKSVHWPDGSGPIQKYIYYYDENNYLLEKRIFDYDSSEWILQKKIIYYYDGNDNLVEKLAKTWDGSEFENYSKTVYIYDENNNISYYIIQYWIVATFINNSKWIYYYNEHNYLYEIHSKQWDVDESVWLKFSQLFLTRDEETNNLIMMISEYWNEDDNIWEKRLRQTYYYDEDYYCTISLAERWDDEESDWRNIFMKTNYYLPAGSEQAEHKRSDLNKTIEDFQTTEDEIVVNTGKRSGRNMSLTGVEVSINSVLHTSDGDLEFTLSHNDISETIIYRAGGDGDNFINTKLSDRGMDSVSNGIAPFIGIYKPEYPLLPFAGVDPEGTWTLRIYDGVDGNTGILQAWSLVLIYSSNSSVVDEPSEAFAFEIFPNPAVSVVRLQSAVISRQSAVMEIFDLNGRKILEKQIPARPAGGPAGTATIKIDVSALQSGVYFCRLIMENKSVTKKLIIQK